MYLRYSTRRKDGKEHTYWRVVRSVRRNATARWFKRLLPNWES